MLRYITSGESHGKYLSAVLEGFPSGLKLDMAFVNTQLARRQQGFGRGGRQKIETDTVEMTGGVVKGITTGAPLGFLMQNKDFKIDEMPELFRPRPGHADLAGALKYDQGIRAVLERASARETAMRVAVGSVCRLLLRELDIEVVSHVIQIGGVRLSGAENLKGAEIRGRASKSDMNCICKETEARMKEAIQAVRSQKDTLGGQYEIRISGVPIGIGSYVHFERKLDARFAQVLMGMQSVKAVEVGLGTEVASRRGSQAHDEIFYDKKKSFYHKTNRAGGIEGGMSNGEEIVLRVTMKPIATLGQPLASVHLKTRQAIQADYERSDFCAVPAGSVVGEALAAYVTADALLEKTGGDSLKEVRRNFNNYLEQICE